MITATVVAMLVPAHPVAAHVPHDRITNLIASPAYATDHTLYATSREGLIRSTDGGSSWRQIIRGVVGQPGNISASAADPQDVYMGVSGGGVLRSDDQGWSWSRTNSPAALRGVRALAASTTSAQVAFAAPANGLFRTEDGGTTWTQVASYAVATLSFTSTGRLVVGRSDGGVTTSDNGGRTWSNATGVAGGGAITAIASTGGNVFVGTGTGRLLRSTDRGATFTRVGTGLPAEQVTSIAISKTFASDARLWVSSFNKGVYRSTNRGANLTRTSAGLTTNPQAVEYGQAQFGDLAVAAADGAQVLHVAGFDGLFRSDDGATRWRQVQTLADYVVGLAVSPGYPDDGTVVTTTYIKGAYRSTDRGASWQGAHVGLGASSGNNFAPLFRLTNVVMSPNFVEDGTMFTAGMTSVLISTDRGASWTASEVLPPSATQQLFAIAVSPQYATDKTVYVGSTFGTTFRSTAGGAPGSWKKLGSVTGKVQTLLTSPGFPTDPVLYAATSTGIFKSSDAGTSWTRTGPAGQAILAISPDYVNDGTLFAGTDTGLLVTRNRAVGWSKRATAPLSATSDVEAVGFSPDYANDRTVFVSVLGQGLYRSTDRGVSFAATGSSLLDENLLIADFYNPTALPFQFSPNYAEDRTIFAMAQTHIVRSTDGGTTWERLDLPPADDVLTPPVIEQAPSPPRVVEGDAGDEVLRVAVDLSHPSRGTVTVRWRTVDVPERPDAASAEAGDYTAGSGQLTFRPAETRKFIDVVVHGDLWPEIDEQVVIELSDPVGGTLGDTAAVGTIEDDDLPLEFGRAALLRVPALPPLADRFPELAPLARPAKPSAPSPAASPSPSGPSGGSHHAHHAHH